MVNPKTGVQRVKKWYRKFKSGRENIVNESCSGRQISVTNKTFENKVYREPVQQTIFKVGPIFVQK